MNLSKLRSEKKFSSLVQLGAQGHYPLFHPEWLHELSIGEQMTPPLNTQEEAVFISLLEKIQKLRTIKKQRVLLESLDESYRHIFIKAFLKLVEARILDANPILQ